MLRRDGLNVFEWEVAAEEMIFTVADLACGEQPLRLGSEGILQSEVVHLFNRILHVHEGSKLRRLHRSGARCNLRA